MKKLLLLLLLMLPFTAFSQKIKSDKVDDFTGKRVAYTSWEKLAGGLFDNLMYRFRVNGTNRYLDVEWNVGKVTACNKGDKLILKLFNDSIIEFKNTAYTITESKLISKSIYEILDITYEVPTGELEYYPLKLRLYTTSGYYDLNIKEKNAETFVRSFNLLSIEPKM